MPLFTYGSVGKCRILWASNLIDLNKFLYKLACYLANLLPDVKRSIAKRVLPIKYFQWIATHEPKQFPPIARLPAAVLAARRAFAEHLAEAGAHWQPGLSARAFARQPGRH